MRGTVLYGAGDVRVEDVPDPVLREPTDALVRVLRSRVCGSDLWPYRSMPQSETGRRMGHEFLGVVEDTGADVPELRAGDVVSRVGAVQYTEVPMDFGTFFRNITLTGGVAPARACIEDLLPDVLEGRIQPGRVFDAAIGLADVPGGYRAMAERAALKVLIRP